jgi:hypothetical protein
MKLQEFHTLHFDYSFCHTAAQTLRKLDQHFISGAQMRTACGLTDAVWEAFAGCWETLTQDRYMADQGKYRYRRYGEFELDTADGQLEQLPHSPYQQALYINPLNGGILRNFDPLLPEFVNSPFLNSLLLGLTSIFEQTQGYRARWNIRLHPYRILAQEGQDGQPTPEGLHRDGVDYIVSMMVQRNNVTGGETCITDAQGKLLCRHTLLAPLDILVSDDAQTMHGVSSISPVDPSKSAWRDVLVIAFTRIMPAMDVVSGGSIA